MPRDLGDVLHFFLPTEPGGETSAPARRSARPVAEAPSRPAALPIVSLPIGERDVVRAAFAWNLAVEVARRGASATLLTPSDPESAPAWPETGPGPIGAEVVTVDVEDLAALNRAALDVAVARAADAGDGGVVLVRIPPRWLSHAVEARALMRWVLLFSSPDRRDLLEAYGLAKRIVGASAGARIGVTIHGARRVRDAEQAFRHLASVTSRHLSHALLSYGLLVDDLHVYRAIVSRRPIGLEHPQSPAALALRDVARLLLEDARSDAVT